MHYGGIRPFVRLIGLLLIVLAVILVFGVIVSDIIFPGTLRAALGATAFLVGSVLVVHPGVLNYVDVDGDGDGEGGFDGDFDD